MPTCVPTARNDYPHEGLAYLRYCAPTACGCGVAPMATIGTIRCYCPLHASARRNILQTHAFAPRDTGRVLMRGPNGRYTGIILAQTT